MTITLILLAYVANVFLNRWLNKIAYKTDKYFPIIWGLWFIPLALVIPCIIIIIESTEKSESNWFTGKNW